MSAWPDSLTVGPISDWPGALTPEWKRKPSPFGAAFTTTLDELDREVFHVTETAAQRASAELLVAIPAEQFRLDGKPRAQAKATHPGVILSFDSKHGHLSYPCDTFNTWQANLRAIVLSLESLRRVDRYGVTRSGEQYRGFLAIEGAVPAGPMTVEHAFTVLDDLRGFRISREHPNEIAMVLRYAKRVTHPDTGAQNEFGHTFQDVADAERVLREAGLL